MLIDDFMPEFDAVERHQIAIEASPAEIFEALEMLDLRELPWARFLLALRGLPAFLIQHDRRGLDDQPWTLDGLTEFGFVKLAERSGREKVLGVTGRFWRPIDNFSPATKESYGDPVPHGVARAVWNFFLDQSGGDTLLSTETRILCGDPDSRRKFRIYWTVVRPFSGLIRFLMLRRIKRDCEHAHEE